MKPYKDVHESKIVLKKLIERAKNSNNQVGELKDLNVIIRTLNNYDKMVRDKYYTDFFDILILSRLYQTLLINKKEINVNEFLVFFDKDLRVGKEFIKENISGYLQGLQVYLTVRNKKPYWMSVLLNSKVDMLTIIDSYLRLKNTKVGILKGKYVSKDELTKIKVSK